MKISHNWLKKLIHLPEEPAVVAAWLTGLGLEVESLEDVEKIPGSLAGLVIAEVKECEKHPDADKLKVTRVDAGKGELLQVVCGAPNVAAGQKVVLALEGAMLHPAEGESFQIKKSKIRGVASEGMLCAEDEIGLGKSHAGIMVLETALPNGTPAAAYFNLQPEPVYEIGLTPNRVDAASHLGVARDIRALTGRPVIFPALFTFSENGGKGPVSIHIQNDSCHRYAGLYVENVQVGPSPEWLQNHLKSIGINPKNNVVDITNYVLHELGQPLHAFDADKIKGSRIEIRKARLGESIELLDKSKKNLTEEDLVITDAEKPLALAGIMGGIDSGVTESTRNIFIESAWFHPDTIRKSSQKHGVKSDSSFRFERGTDPEMPLKGIMRMASLLAECGAAKITFSPSDEHSQSIEPFRIKARWRNINRLIGEELPRETVLEILHRLDIQVKAEASYGHEGFEEEFEAIIPPFRVDVQREADLVEEILRVYGIDNIGTGHQMNAGFISPGIDDQPEARTQRAAGLLADMGFYEIVQNSLENAALYDGIPEYKTEESVPLLNRLSEDLGFMRQSLLFSALEAAAYNLNRKQENLRLFEFGKIYRKADDKITEKYALSMLITGKWSADSWEVNENRSSFFHLKKSIENLLNRLGLTGWQWKNENPSFMAFGQSLYFQNKAIGWAGLIQEETARKKEVRQAVLFAQLDWDVLRKAKPAKLKVADVPRFPAVTRDLSVVLDKKTGFEQIELILRQSNRKLVREVSVFDVYEGDKIESGKKAYAMSILLQDEEQTLTDQKIEGLMNAIMQKLEKDLGAVIRK
jgi:phenylalanyl-tRNA synthetase beta chain